MCVCVCVGVCVCACVHVCVSVGRGGGAATPQLTSHSAALRSVKTAAWGVGWRRG